MKHFMLLICATAMLAACAPGNSKNSVTDSNDGHIIGGDYVSRLSNIGRSTVGIYESKIGYICTGTLVAPHLVLTAAHCVDPKAKNLTIIFAAAMKGVDKTRTRPVVQWIVHPKYSTDTQAQNTNDLALLRFEGDAVVGYTPAAILFDEQAVKNGTNTIVAGYGLNFATGISTGAGTLRSTTLNVDNAHFSNTEAMLGQTVKRGICSGDSGGPAYLEVNGQLEVWGVASRGDSIPLPLVPKCMLFSVFTRVSAHQDFIVNAMAELSAK
jgi:secreted trypsin-like serine protease